MMAPLGPHPAIVGKLGSMKPGCFARQRSTCAPTSNSLRPALVKLSSSHEKKSTSASPSKTCAVSSPFISAGFFFAFISEIGVVDNKTFPPSFSTNSSFSSPSVAARSSAQLADAGSSHTLSPLPAASLSAPYTPSYGETSTPSLAKCAATSPPATFPGSINKRSAPSPLLGTIKYESATGLNSTSAPRKFVIHITSSSMDTSSQSTPPFPVPPAAAILPLTAATFSATPIPASFPACTLTAALGIPGRFSPHTLSTRLCGTATSRIPATFKAFAAALTALTDHTSGSIPTLSPFPSASASHSSSFATPGVPDFTSVHSCGSSDAAWRK
mmetsp:Transcript_23746/g.59021  ORF Transcript_23746/g.59021 Transcript_23746/m.59021 type:complete len:329 (+) Transcript_23746:767-1753(+)